MSWQAGRVRPPSRDAPSRRIRLGGGLDSAKSHGDQRCSSSWRQEELSEFGFHMGYGGHVRLSTWLRRGLVSPCRISATRALQALWSMLRAALSDRHFEHTRT